MEPLTVAYLTNRYPHFSHTFIRREITALENLGTRVQRYSLRPPVAGLVDSLDLEEVEKVHVILGQSWYKLVKHTLKAAWKRPAPFLRATLAVAEFIRHSRGRVIPNLAYLVEACHLLEEFSCRPVDVLHAHFGTNPAAVAILLQRLGGPPCVLTLHGPEEYADAPRLSLALKVREAGAVRCISEDGKRQVLGVCPGLEAPKVRVIHCGLERWRLDAQPKPVPAFPAILCVGRLDEQKSHTILFEALSQLKVNGRLFQLDLIGGGSLRPELEQLVDELDLKDRIRFRGWCSGAEVAQAMAGCRLLVLASEAEGLPIVILEALAAGRPVVASGVNGIREVVKDSCGLTVPAGNPDALALAIEQALAWDDEEVRSRGAAGRQIVREEFDGDTLAKEIDRLHRIVIREKQEAGKPGTEA